MRHEQIADADSYDRVEIAAAWPATARLVPPPVPEIAAEAAQPFVPTPAAPDVPAAAGRSSSASSSSPPSSRWPSRS